VHEIGTVRLPWQSGASAEEAQTEEGFVHASPSPTLDAEGQEPPGGRPTVLPPQATTISTESKANRQQRRMGFSLQVAGQVKRLDFSGESND
jgi:hypothetical protein